MEIIRGFYNLKKRHQECVITIGNFDGLHLGHQALIKKLVEKGQELNLPTLTIIFEPQPNEFFSHKTTPRLMRFREKIEGLMEQGIDRVLCVHFDEKIALQTADVFVRRILIEKLAVKYVLIGDDFRFGYKRLGDIGLLKNFGEKYHFQTEALETFKLLEKRVSSTRIRKLLEAGNLTKVRILLGRQFSMKGKVIHGDKRGRLLGFPTANIHLHRKETPIKGVFAVEVLGLDHEPIPGVANIGTRPTITGEQRLLLEVHLLNFTRDIYGQKVEIRFLKKFRDEKKFASLDELKKQIQDDIFQAERYHALD
jgi:riboflavin kinase / FMN adenylyltransferase